MKALKYLIMITVLVGLAWLGAQRMADAQTITGFHHTPHANLQGYYIPINEVRVGNFKLNHISIGTNDELNAFEKTGKSDIENYAPAMFAFDDTTSPTGTNELGQTYYERTERVLPQAYDIRARRFVFSGTGKTLGPVNFTGHADPEKIKTARNSFSHTSEGAAMTGTLTVGKTTIKNVELMWFGGD